MMGGITFVPSRAARLTPGGRSREHQQGRERQEYQLPSQPAAWLHQPLHLFSHRAGLFSLSGPDDAHRQTQFPAGTTQERATPLPSTKAQAPPWNLLEHKVLKASPCS